MVKNVHCKSLGISRASSIMVVPPPINTVMPELISVNALEAIFFLFSLAYTLPSWKGNWKDLDNAPPYTLITWPFSASSFKSLRMVSSETFSWTLKSEDKTLLCRLI